MNFNIFTYQSKIIIPYNLAEIRFNQVIDDMIFIDNNLYFVEQDGSKLYEYNILTNYCNYYLIPNTKYLDWGCFSGVYLFGQIIYLFTRTAEFIHCFDTINKEFTSIVTGKMAIVMNSFRSGNKIYLYGEKIICFDIENNFLAVTYYFDKEKIYWMNQYKSTIFFLTRNQIGIWDKDSNSKKSLYIETNLAEKFFLCLLTEDKVFMLPNQSKDILILDRKTGVSMYSIFPKDLYYIEKGWGKYYGYTEETQYIWCANRVSNYLLCIDKGNEDIKWIKIKPPALRDEIPYLKLVDKNFFYESEIDIEEFLLIDNVILHYRKDSCGKEIWRYLE
ncbi:MAG: hypothetical protein HFI12_08040 [Lachnospiraceae bacterium]|nr:hypothetical protein [Lachnospiraceae bacterium]